MGGLLAILATEKPVEDAESALHTCRRCSIRRVCVRGQLPGLAAVRLERFVGCLDADYLRLFANRIVNEFAVRIARPLPVAGAVCDRSCRAVGTRRDIGPYRECAVVVDGRLRPGSG
jgi:hypothetical protein